MRMRHDLRTIPCEGEMVELSFAFIGKTPKEDMQLCCELFESGRISAYKVAGHWTIENVDSFGLILRATFGVDCHRH